MIGVEASPVPFLFSALSVRLFGPRNLSFSRGNFLDIPLSPARSYVCYLSTIIMEQLKSQLVHKLLPGCVLISMVFALPDSTPLEEVQVDDLLKSRIFVYGASQ